MVGIARASSRFLRRDGRTVAELGLVDGQILQAAVRAEVVSFWADTFMEDELDWPQARWGGGRRDVAGLGLLCIPSSLFPFALVVIGMEVSLLRWVVLVGVVLVFVTGWQLKSEVE